MATGHMRNQGRDKLSIFKVTKNTDNYYKRQWDFLLSRRIVINL